MCRKKILEKFLAIILIFTLTFANFAFITKSYASSFAEVLFGVTSDTGSKSVSFDAYFDIEGEHCPSVISDVNYNSLFINMDLDVKDKGYLKDAKIEFVEGEEGKNINFVVKEDITEETEKTQDDETNSDEQDIASEENEIQGENQNQGENQEENQKENQGDVQNRGEVNEQPDGEKTSNENSENNDKSSENQNVEQNESSEASSEENNNEETNKEESNNEIAEENSTEDVQNNFEVEGQENTEEVAGIEEESTVEDLIEAEEHIDKFEENVFYLNQIDATSEMRIQVPIEYQNEQYINEEKVSGDTLVVFSGVYVNNKGEEVEVSKQVKLFLGWKDNRDVDLSEGITKYIDYGQGIILQTVEKVDNREKGNTLPVKSTELEITAPILKDAKPSRISVVANTTKGINGEEASSVNFGEDNWNYNEEENKLRIKVENEKQKVEVNYHPDEYLQDSEKEIVEEERYYNGSGINEFLVTYTYENIDANESLTVNSNVTAKMTTVSGENEEKSNIVTNSKDYNYELGETTGDIVSLNIENKKEEISKAYTYVNYNNEGRYETEIPSEIMVNVSYKDIVEGIILENRANTYVDKAGNEIANNDLYYKTVGIAKENFESILGENGEIKVKDEAGNEIFVINKDTQVNEAGQILVGFAEKYSRLSFEMSKPVGEGNLVISVVKAMQNASVDKNAFINIDRINSKTTIKANYNYVEGLTEVGTVETNEKLIDTATEANLVIDRESLSTVEENKDVEIRVELNNAKETSDVYGNSVYEIELPENVENIELTNVSLLYGEGLEIVNTEVNGRVIRVAIEGKQEGINSGVLTNGTNIVLNANIKVNLYTPAKNEVVRLRYNNSEATSYVDGGYKEVGISYSAPTGLVAVTRITGYDNEGSVVESVRQGKKEGIIAVYAESRTVTSEIVVMNNHNNTVSNMNILGRIPYAGVKDIKTGEELGTTLDSKMVSGIVGNEANKGNFVVYYSENGEATQELDKEENGWTREPASLENIKSYLIVPEDENYVMEKSEILRFTYNYEVPENLKHNEHFYGTFGVYYRNNSEVAKTNELAIPDLVGITTGVGPELKVTVTPSKEQVKEYEEFALNVTVENVGEVRAENVNVDVLQTEKATVTRYETDIENVLLEDIIENVEYFDTAADEMKTYEAKKGTRAKISSLDIGNTITFKVYLKAGGLGSKSYFENEEKYKNGETDDLGALITEKLEKDVIEPIVKVTADDLGATLESKAQIQLVEAEMAVSEQLSAINAIESAGNKVELYIFIENLNSTKSMNNVVVTKELPKELKLLDATEGYEYNEESRVISWNLEKIENRDKKILQITAEINELDENITKARVETFSNIKAEGTDLYTTNTVFVDVAKPILVITQTSSNIDTYIKEGETLRYTYLVKNEGEVFAKSVNLSNVVPDGISVTNVDYDLNGIKTNRAGVTNDKINITADISPGAEMVVNLEAVALNLNGANEKSVTNYATISSKEIKEISSNSITHIIEASDNQRSDEEDGDPYILPENNISRTYKISGLAWFDSNQDGMRNNDEELLSGIAAKLVDSTSGVIQKTVTTDSNGEYVFSGVGNGTYLVIFEYDISKYTVTTYQKDGIVSNVNSDALLTTINQDGKSIESAVTDSIKVDGGSIGNIDIGLVLLNKFDLKLDKTISKVMVQTSKETTTENYDNVSLAKADIAAKYLSGATVYVEYTITVSNVGDIAGYAKKIVDYLPKGMNLNSSLESNSDWYTGTDGNLYSEKLSNKELKSGQSETLKLVLTKQMTEENTGIVNNLAEIYEDYNTYGITDKNSTPGNKVQNENDMGSADLIISVKTGEMFIYISIIITTVLLGSIAIFISYNKIVSSKRKRVM